MSDENRRFTRLKYDVPAVVTVGGTVFSVKEIINLSVGGALIPCDQNFPNLTKCTFQIPIGGTTDNTCIEVQGEFVWSNKSQAAIKFTSIAPDSLMLLQNIIRYNTEDTGKVDAEMLEHLGLI